MLIFIQITNKVRKMESKNWFIHVEWAVLLMTFLGGFYILDSKIEKQSSRTDRLYEMFCDLQNQIKNEILAMKKEQYEFMRETKK